MQLMDEQLSSRALPKDAMHLLLERHDCFQSFLTKLDSLPCGEMQVDRGNDAKITREEWDSLLFPEDSVFLEHGFLASLEDSGCVDISRGWQPRFITVRDADRRLLGAVPFYLKMYLHGEFCEETGWIHAARSMKVLPYPRLFVGIPFTPHRGRRLLTAAFLDMERHMLVEGALLRALKCVSMNTGLSVNVAFGDLGEVHMLSKQGFLTRQSRQTVWSNRQPQPYRSFDDFLGTLRAKNRTEIARQRKAVADVEDLEIEVVDGALNPEAVTPALMSRVFQVCYASTQERHGNVTGGPLSAQGSSLRGRYDFNEEFFERLASKFARRMLLVIARRPKGGPEVAGALCFTKGRRICGRYWGHILSEERAVPYLHFECCYHMLIEHAIKHGYSFIEPGNGGGDIYKVQRFRGFEPALTPSSLLVPDAELRQEVACETRIQDAEGAPSWTAGRYSAYAPAASGKRRRKGAERA